MTPAPQAPLMGLPAAACPAIAARDRLSPRSHVRFGRRWDQPALPLHVPRDEEPEPARHRGGWVPNAEFAPLLTRSLVHLCTAEQRAAHFRQAARDAATQAARAYDPEAARAHLSESERCVAAWCDALQEGLALAGRAELQPWQQLRAALRDSRRRAAFVHEVVGWALAEQWPGTRVAVLRFVVSRIGPDADLWRALAAAERDTNLLFALHGSGALRPIGPRPRHALALTTDAARDLEAVLSQNYRQPDGALVAVFEVALRACRAILMVAGVQVPSSTPRHLCVTLDVAAALLGITGQASHRRLHAARRGSNTLQFDRAAGSRARHAGAIDLPMLVDDVRWLAAAVEHRGQSPALQSGAAAVVGSFDLDEEDWEAPCGCVAL